MKIIPIITLALIAAPALAGEMPTGKWRAGQTVIEFKAAGFTLVDGSGAVECALSNVSVSSTTEAVCVDAQRHVLEERAGRLFFDGVELTETGK